jgi:hypothetical protein
MMTSNARNAAEDALGLQKMYFDTSVWGHITDAPDRDALIRSLKRRRQTPLASVISVAQILLTPDLNKRTSLCGTILTLHGDRQVLERPLELAETAASAFLRGERTLCIKESAPAKSFYDALSDPRNAPIEKIKPWIENMDSKLERFIHEIRPPLKEEATDFLTPEVLERGDFLAALCRLPTAQRVRLSTDRLRALCRSSDVWRALAGTLAYIIQLSITHAPKKRKKDGKRTERPDGADIWQIVYLGCVPVFVTGDQWMLEAATQVSRLLKYPRCTISSFDFFKALRRFASGKPFPRGICPVCGIPTGQLQGGHAVAKKL